MSTAKALLVRKVVGNDYTCDAAKRRTSYQTGQVKRAHTILPNLTLLHSHEALHRTLPSAASCIESF